MSDIFLSYTREDQATARHFAEGFEREGLTVWWDQTLRSGENYDQVTETALREAKAVVVLWSRRSVDSRWVRAEATQADRNGTLMPVMIEPCNRPIMFELKHTAELAHWRGESADAVWRAFLGDVRQFVKKEAPAASPAAILQPSRPPRQLNIRILVGAGALLAIAAAALWWVNRPPSIAPMPSVVGATASQTAAREVTLAVLPFANLSSDPEQEYFSDGLTEEVLNQLAQVKDLRVTARTSSFSFKGKDEDVRVVAQRLGVANLLEGSVRKDGTHLRITAQLISGRDGAHVWSRSYDRELKDVFAVQEDIAKDVATALSIKLDVGSMSRARGGTDDLEAYDRYLQARALLHQFGSAQILRACALYREALVIDPNFALAWHGLYTALGYSLVASPNTAVASRKEMELASNRLAALAPDAWWTLAAHADQLMLKRQWSEAEKSAAAAVAQTADVDAIAMDATFLMSVGRIGEAVDALERARRADPLSLRISGLLQLYLDVAGRSNEAETEFQRSKGLAGDHSRPEWAAFLRAWRRGDAKPAEIRSAIRALPGNRPLEHELLPVLDKPDAALEIIHRALDATSVDNWAPLTAISFYADHYGDEQLAVTAMRRSFLDFNKVNFEGLWWPFHSSLRASPGFKELLRELGLVAYFRTSGKWGDFCKPVGKDDFECH